MYQPRVISERRRGQDSEHCRVVECESPDVPSVMNLTSVISLESLITMWGPIERYITMPSFPTPPVAAAQHTSSRERRRGICCAAGGAMDATQGELTWRGRVRKG